MNYNSLYDIVTENAILGYALNYPSLLLEEEFPLTISDFHNRRNQIIFSAANNMALEGVSKIEPVDLDIYLRRFPEQYAVYEKNQGIEGIMTLTKNREVLDKAQFNILYQRLKKFAVLRDLESAGISTNEFYCNDVFTSENENFENATLDDFISRIKEKVNDIEEKYRRKSEAKGISVAEGLRVLIEEYKITPAVGATLDGEIYNYAVRGARLGKMYLTSSPSGQGKTRRMVGQACALALPYLNNRMEIVTKEEYHPAVFFSTEQSVKEIQTLVLAYVSGVNEAKITDGLINCTDSELKRIEIAIQIIELFQDYLMLEQIPDPSIGLVRSKALQYIYKKHVQYIFFDYIFTSPSLVSEFASSRLREDVVLLMLSNALKEIATIYDVFIMSGTQVTGDYLKPCFRGMNFLRGSKAIADKIDVGACVVKLYPEELDMIMPIVEVGGVVPNVVSDIYKNRSGSMTEMKIFSIFDYGTCHMKDLFVTDLSYNPVDIEDRVIFKEKQETLNTVNELKEHLIKMERGTVDE